MERRRGFSFLECLIAVMVLSIGVLGAMSAMSFSVTQQQHAELMPVAAYYAQQIMEDIRINRRHVSVPAPGVPDADSGLNSPAAVPIDAAPFDGVFNRIKDTNSDGVLNGQDQSLNLSRYKRSVTMTRLSGSLTNYKSNLVRVVVTIYWLESTGVDQKNPGNSQSTAHSGGKKMVTRSLQVEAVLN